MSKTYQLNDKGQFEIHNYEKQKPFSSFLPGIAGKHGIPIWAFYVNRGQGIASFGSKDKDHSIMEFYPANKSYSNVETKGFRTFIKIKKKDEIVCYEAFRNNNHDKKTKLVIDRDHFEIEETNERLGFKIIVKYFIMPNENYGALVRQVGIVNISDAPLSLEVLDGLPVMIAYDMNNEALKNVSQTVSAWSKVYNLEGNVPFFRLRASSTDEAEVKELQAGNFYLSYVEENGKQEIIQPIVDPGIVFEDMTSLEAPKGFYSKSFIDLDEKQMTENRLPCAMTPYAKEIAPDDTLKINSLIGYLDHQDKIDYLIEKVQTPNYVKNKEAESKAVHNYYVDHVAVKSNNEIHDAYLKQTFLDNILRGGFPINLSQEKTYHIFSRKHGDLERDYNQFSLATTPYSQGNGNYRDVNQNRRSDLFINPNVSTANIKLFTNLIQLNGYNPLVIKGQHLLINDMEAFNKYLKSLDDRTALIIRRCVKGGFTPGELLSAIDMESIELPSKDELIEKIADYSIIETKAEHGEGYWVDHWTYILDLIENYLYVYPDTLEEVMLNEKYYFYDSAHKVLPRHEKHVLTPKGVRQYNSVAFDEEKYEMINKRSFEKYKVRTNHGHGKTYETSLFNKLLTLGINKLAQLDPFGRGIEMEADKPGWYDALNGMPGLLGSSVAETAELNRLARFLKEVLNTLDFNSIVLPIEIKTFMDELVLAVNSSKNNADEFILWKKSADLREFYRNEVFYGISGTEVEVSQEKVLEMLNCIIDKTTLGLKDSMNEKGLFNQFYKHEVLEFNERKDLSPQGYPLVNVKTFESKPLPAFLEGQVKGMKILEEKSTREALHASVLASDLFDSALGMFKVNGDLTEESFEIGRARAFTPGWLENESIWLHMEYKYLLELIKSEQYEAFYEAAETALIPNLDPDMYGRSTLENSSFILSSANVEESNHGRGYIARLSGATAEYISIFYQLTLGNQPFKWVDNTLIFNPKPILRGSDFTTETSELTLQVKEDKSTVYPIKKNAYAFRFLGHTLISYINKSRKDTYGKNSAVIDGYIVKYYGNEETIKVKALKDDIAKDLRKGKIEVLEIIMK